MRPLAQTPLAELDVTNGHRPAAPHLPEATEAHRRQGRILGLIHQHYLQGFALIAQVLSQIEDGTVSPQALVKVLNEAELAQNIRKFGTLCGQQCKILHMHHDAEEAMMFPPIVAQNNPKLRSVIERLRAEHLVVSELIHRLEEASRALVQETTPAQLAATQKVFVQLAKVVQSHFGYEEDQLDAALGLYVRVF